MKARLAGLVHSDDDVQTRRDAKSPVDPRKPRISTRSIHIHNQRRPSIARSPVSRASEEWIPPRHAGHFERLANLPDKVAVEPLLLCPLVDLEKRRRSIVDGQFGDLTVRNATRRCADQPRSPHPPPRRELVEDRHRPDPCRRGSERHDPRARRWATPSAIHVALADVEPVPSISSTSTFPLAIVARATQCRVRFVPSQRLQRPG